DNIHSTLSGSNFRDYSKPGMKIEGDSEYIKSIAGTINKGDILGDDIDTSLNEGTLIQEQNSDQSNRFSESLINIDEESWGLK
ncbi:MAG: hypothetical protein KAH38_03310, partial [Candidatus Hydrogenedentes bacterium]|nr:hypothetical protein [Candidatus Hydrogenedentota bacterium]